MTPYTPTDVEFALLRVAQAAEVVKTLDPTNTDAKQLDQQATGLLKLVQMRAFAAAGEVLVALKATAHRVYPRGELAVLLFTTLERAEQTLSGYLEQERKITERSKLIDENDDDLRSTTRLGGQG